MNSSSSRLPSLFLQEWNKFRQKRSSNPSRCTWQMIFWDCTIISQNQHWVITYYTFWSIRTQICPFLFIENSVPLWLQKLKTTFTCPECGRFSQPFRWPLLLRNPADRLKLWFSANQIIALMLENVWPEQHTWGRISRPSHQDQSPQKNPYRTSGTPT